jgi:hypothetical protein
MPSQTTYSSNDWNIWSYEPVAGKFLLDFSKLDDATTPLSATDGSIVIVDCEITEIMISEGTTATSGLFFDPRPSTANVVIQLKNFNKSYATKFFPGTDFWITFKNGDTANNSYKNLGTRTPIFFGKTSSFDVQVNPSSDFATISISANSIVTDQLNTLLRIDTSTGIDKNIAIEDAARALGFFCDLDGVPSFYQRGIVIKTYGEFLSEYVATGIKLPGDYVYHTSIGGTALAPNIVYEQGVRANAGSHTTGGASFTFNESKISSIQYDWVHADAPTGVTLTNEGNSSIVYQRGTDGSGFMYTATVDLPDISWMEVAGNNMINYKKLFSPVSIETTLATNGKTIKWGNYGSTFSAYLYPQGLVPIGKVLEITLAENGFTAERTVITGRTIEITPDNWNVTYNLWKGFSF